VTKIIFKNEPYHQIPYSFLPYLQYHYIFKIQNTMKIVLLRHGQSLWNKENKFTGWTDVGLTQKGIEEAKEAGRILQSHNFQFDIAYTSYLKRAIKSLWLVLEEMDLMWIPVEKNWQLNERHYGALQGFNKKEMAEKVGEEQVHLWRRSFVVRPPLLKISDARNPIYEFKYKNVSPSILPLGESLEDTISRLNSYWLKNIWKLVEEKRCVLIVAHGNSLRGIIKYLDNLSNEEITREEIPAGLPLVYEFDDNLIPIKKYYLKMVKSQKEEKFIF
jgi:2,3-bisphosphoglycerate-dependent phosphoglycerate mutase